MPKTKGRSISEGLPQRSIEHTFAHMRAAKSFSALKDLKIYTLRLSTTVALKPIEKSWLAFWFKHMPPTPYPMR
jgi:hypothetical protein